MPRSPETYVGYFLYVSIRYSDRIEEKNLIIFQHPMDWLTKQKVQNDSVIIRWWTHILGTADDYQRWSKTLNAEPIPQTVQEGRSPEVHS